MTGRSFARKGVTFTAFAAAVLVASLAVAQGKATPESRRARALFEEGVALSDEGKWADALAAFQKSDELVPSPVARYNIGTTLRALGRYVEARKVLQKLVDDAPTFKPPMKPALQKDVNKVLGEVKEKIVTISVKVTPVDADVQMDGTPLSRLPDGRVELDPGKHVFVASAKGFETTTVTQTLTVSGAEVVLAAPKIVPKVQVVKETPIYARAWFITTLSVLVAGGAATGIIFATRPKTTPPAGPPTATVDRVIPAAATVRF
jgi:tetratricopeptide (TPR) repeat protein